jgi:hypothetical protein
VINAGREERLPEMTPKRLPLDPVLGEVASATSDADRDVAIANLLVGHAYELAGRILQARFRQYRLEPDQFADLRHEVVIRLVTRFRRSRLEDDPIESFPDYVATVAFNVFEDYARKRYPLRSGLRNRTLYALSRDPQLAVWTHGGTSVCGLQIWKGRAPSDAPLPVPGHTGESDLRVILRRMFLDARAPHTLDDVVSALAAASGIPANESPLPLDEAAGLASCQPDASVALSSSDYLRKLWKEIEELPVHQRIALLLQSRDSSGESVIRLLADAGIATLEELARSLEMEDDELLHLLPALPADDLTLARRLDLGRQQVINLRRAARTRLLRRMNKPANTRWPAGNT